MSAVGMRYGMGNDRAFGAEYRAKKKMNGKTAGAEGSVRPKSTEDRLSSDPLGESVFAKNIADVAAKRIGAEDTEKEAEAVKRETEEAAARREAEEAAARRETEAVKREAATQEIEETATKQETEAAELEKGIASKCTETKSPRDMSLEEYAQYIYGIISELSRRNYSRGNSVFIYISEEGFRAMQNDPEYEAWVMENIRQAYQYCGSRGGHDGYHSAHFFGATKEEYQGQSWHSGCSKCEQERRRERKLRRKKRLEAYLKKRRERKLLEERRLAKLRLEKAFYKKLLAKRRMDRESLEEGWREEALARREAASAFRMYQAIAKYSEQ